MDNSQKSIGEIVRGLLEKIKKGNPGTLSLTELSAFIKLDVDKSKFNHLIQKYKLWTEGPDVQSPDVQIKFSTVIKRLNKLQRHQCRHPEEKPCCDPCQPYCPHCCFDHGCCENCHCRFSDCCLKVHGAVISTQFPSDHNHCTCP